MTELGEAKLGMLYRLPARNTSPQPRQQGQHWEEGGVHHPATPMLKVLRGGSQLAEQEGVQGGVLGEEVSPSHGALCSCILHHSTAPHSAA